MSSMSSSLRVRRLDNDLERNVARWLFDSNGDFDLAAACSGLSVKAIRFWVKSLPSTSGLRRFL